MKGFSFYMTRKGWVIARLGIFMNNSLITGNIPTKIGEKYVLQNLIIRKSLE